MGPLLLKLLLQGIASAFLLLFLIDFVDKGKHHYNLEAW